MKALMYTGIGQMELQELPMPEDKFIVRVIGSGVCGTDLKTYLKGHHFFTPPVILGHEFYGEVYKAPEDCGYKVGDIVVAAPYCECGVCDVCLRGAGQLCTNKTYINSGAFTEYVGIPLEYLKNGVFKVDNEDDVYTLVEPLACVINGSEHLNIKDISRVLIIGGGPMGSLFALLFKDKGIPVSVVEPSKSRRDLIASWGIEVYEPGEPDYSKYDNIVVAVNKAEIVEECVKKIADAGTTLVFSGLPKEVMLEVQSYAIHYREVTIAGSFGYGIKHFRQALEMIKNNPGHFSRVITHKLPLKEGVRAFEMLQKAEPLKLVLKP